MLVSAAIVLVKAGLYWYSAGLADGSALFMLFYSKMGLVMLVHQNGLAGLRVSCLYASSVLGTNNNNRLIK